MVTNERLRDTTYRDNCQRGQGCPGELDGYGGLIDDEWLKPGNAIEVRNPFYDSPVTEMKLSTFNHRS